MRRRWFAALIAAALAGCPAFGQGVGIPASPGFVPRIDVAHRQVGVANTLILRGFAPGTPVLIVASGETAGLPLAPFGLGPAVLGPDPSLTLGSVVLPPLFAGSTGRINLPVTVPPALVHQPIHVQAGGVDSGAPIGGFALSEHRALMFGLDPSTRPFAVETSPGRFAIYEGFPYGQPTAEVDLRLLDVAPVDLVLTNSNEMAAGRTDRPVPDPFGGFGQVIELPDGSRLAGVRSATFEDGLVRLAPDGRVQVLVWAQGTALCPAFCPEVGVSAFDPWMALVAENPLPEYGGATLLLVRTDGESAPGSHESVVPITPPGGLVPSGTTLCFLDGALFYGDGATTLMRLDLGTFQSTPVAFPPSAGATPIYVDEQCAPAADGSALAIGAGASDASHDVYVVEASGSAANLTNSPSDYEDAGAGQKDGMQLVMDATGDHVALMHTVIETETFVYSTQAPLTITHVTNPTQYIDSIDTVVGLGFVLATSVVLNAGKDCVSTDVYEASIPPAGGPAQVIQNVSQTSGILAPPFGLGATLELERRFTTGGGAHVTLSNIAGVPAQLDVVAPGGDLCLASGTVQAVVAVNGGFAFVDQTAAGAPRVRVVTTSGAPAVSAVWIGVVGQVLEAHGGDLAASRAAFVVGGVGVARQLLIADATSVAAFPMPMAGAGTSVAVEAAGTVLVTTAVAGGSETHRFDPASGAWTLLAQSSFPTRLLH